MMKVLTFAAILGLSGCATVSMVSKDTVVETQASRQSSELTRSAKAFNETAETEGWVGDSRSIMDFASILFSSRSERTGRDAASYADRISAASAETGDVFETVAEDARAAAEAFARVQAVADRVLASGTVERGDLINFETALVTAQKSYRGFAEATGIAAGRGDDGLAETEAALKDLASAIDAARGSADDLAEAYASEADKTVAS